MKIILKTLPLYVYEIQRTVQDPKYNMIFSQKIL